MKISAIIPAAGSGSRYSKNSNKLLENFNDMPVIIHTLKTISKVEKIDEIIICTSLDIIEQINELILKHSISKVQHVILGGKSRQESVFIGLKNCSNPDYVLIHDGARPLINLEVVDKSINAAIKEGAAIVAVPAKDTIKKVDKDMHVVETPDRSQLWNVQTPQVFKFKDALKAHELFQNENLTDDSALAEKMGLNVAVVMGSYKNIKITTQEDLKIAEIFNIST